MTVVVILLGSCTTRDTGDTPPPSGITQVLERHTDSLMKISGVVGTAEGSCAGRPCILVLVERLTTEIRKAIPSQIEGIQVQIQETGRIRAQ